MAACLISAGLWLLGLDAHARPIWRHDAAIRVDGGMVAQIGAFAAVAYGNDGLPRHGDARAFALPLFAPPSPGSLAARFGGAGGALTPGSPAHVALFSPEGPPPTRAALREAAFAQRGTGAGIQILLDGRLDPDAGTLAAWRRALDEPETPAEAALWAAVRARR